MNIKPLILLGTTQCESLGRSLYPLVESWAADWFSMQPVSTVNAVPLSRNIEATGKLRGVRFTDPSGEHWAICAIDRSSRERFVSMLLCHPDGACRLSEQMGVSHTLIQEAISDLVARLLPLPDGEYTLSEEETLESNLGDNALDPGNEIFQLMIDMEGVAVDLWFSVHPFQSRISSPMPTSDLSDEPLAHPKEVLGDQTLNFEVCLGNSELTLGMISRLKVGDVIRLDKEIQDPLFCSFQKSPAKFGCYLGRQDNHLALRIDSLMNE